MMSPGATSPNLRIAVIDAIRGLAILGILFANIQSWSGYKFIPLTTIETLPIYHLDSMLGHLNRWLIDGKFYAIFSLLFGAGFGIQYLKNRGNQAPFIKTYRRRLGFLLLFGVLHALLWSGDILTLYALLAFILVLLRNMPAERLLALAILLLCCFAVSQTVMLFFADAKTAIQTLAHKTYTDMSPQTISDAFGHGSWADVFCVNLHNLYWRWMEFLPNGRISRVLGFFVLGFYLAISGYFQSTIYSSKHLIAYLLLGISATAAASYTGTNMSYWAVSATDVLLKMVLVSGQAFLALAYMSLLAMVFSMPGGAKILRPLTLIGRMAFTSYLLQTIIGVSFFYGVGLGYWGSMGLAQLWMLAVVIYAAQVVFCTAWLRFYKQGPLEWLWGCLTAGRYKSNRLVPAG
jgi:uncharacterized protein